MLKILMILAYLLPAGVVPNVVPVDALPKEVFSVDWKADTCTAVNNTQQYFNLPTFACDSEEILTTAANAAAIYDPKTKTIWYDSNFTNTLTPDVLDALRVHEHVHWLQDWHGLLTLDSCIPMHEAVAYMYQADYLMTFTEEVDLAQNTYLQSGWYQQAAAYSC